MRSVTDGRTRVETKGFAGRALDNHGWHLAGSYGTGRGVGVLAAGTQPTRSRSTSLGLRSRVAGRRRGAPAREGQMRPSLFYYWLRGLWEKGTRLDSPMKGIGDGCQRFMPCHPRQLLARGPDQRDTQRVAVVDPARVQRRVVSGWRDEGASVSLESPEPSCLSILCRPGMAVFQQGERATILRGTRIERNFRVTLPLLHTQD